MGYKIGMPSMKLNNAGVKSKNCGSLRDVSREGLEEREGHDPDINKELSKENIYTGYRTAAELMAYSREHVDQLRDARGRKLRADAVVMCATIIKPPAAYMATLSKEEQIRLLDVAEGVVANAIGRDNIKATATHFDELGVHRHIFWEPMTKDGRMCAKEVHNLKFFSQINKEVPTALREAGFAIDDCEMYDAAKEDYEKAKKKAEKVESGRSSYQFKVDAEKARQEAVQELQTAKADLQEIRELAEIDREAHKAAVKLYEQKEGELYAKTEDMEENLQDAHQELQNARQELQTIKGDVDGLQAVKNVLTASLSRFEDVQVDIDACTLQRTPIPFKKDKVMVDAADLSRLEEQARAGAAARIRLENVEKREQAVKGRESKLHADENLFSHRERELKAKEVDVSEKERIVDKKIKEQGDFKQKYDDLRKEFDFISKKWKELFDENERLKRLFGIIKMAVQKLIKGEKFGLLNDEQSRYAGCIVDAISKDAVIDVRDINDRPIDKAYKARMEKEKADANWAEWYKERQKTTQKEHKKGRNDLVL